MEKVGRFVKRWKKLDSSSSKSKNRKEKKNGKNKYKMYLL
jgi:hypothetical protein